MDFEKEFPRFFDLIKTYSFTSRPEGLFYEFEQSLIGSRLKLASYRDIENVLSALDEKAWVDIRKRMADVSRKKINLRGWAQVLECVNEARAFNYLKSTGVEDLEFLKRRSGKTPDIKGVFGSIPVICECKTINRALDPNGMNPSFHVGEVSRQLSQGFFNRLRSNIETGFSQIEALELGKEARKILYLVPNFDDLLHEYVDDYVEEIQEFMVNSLDLPNIDYIFDVKPEFYSTTADYPHSRLYLFSSRRTWRQIEQ